MRRWLDGSIAACALLFLSPLLGLVALAVRVRLGSPVLFRQERTGRYGIPFEMVKFRTMTDARDLGGSALPDASRLPAVGSVMRRCSLDELPQFWHVVRGDMSLVGPRPLPTRYMERYSAEQRRRLSVTPGMTGWAQVHGRNALSWNERLRLDVEYVEHASPWLDTKIVWLTVKVILTRQGVNAVGHATMPEFTGIT